MKSQLVKKPFPKVISRERIEEQMAVNDALESLPYSKYHPKAKEVEAKVRAEHWAKKLAKAA